MWLIVLVSLVLVLVVAFFAIKNKECKVKDYDFHYKKKDYLLSSTEKIAYNNLCDSIYKSKLNVKIFPKIRLTDFIWSPKNDRNAYLHISGKFTDFLIVTRRHLHPVATVFIINNDNKAKINSLAVIEPILNSADIKLIKIKQEDVYNRDMINKILSDIKIGGTDESE